MKKVMVGLGIFLLCIIGILVLGRKQMEKKNVLAVKPLREESFFLNPSDLSNIGDPFVLRIGEVYYCYPTSSSNGYKVYTSKDLSAWEEVGQVYSATRNGWANQDFWAPEVFVHEGRYYMYYTARWKENKSLRIGLAISDQPTGPFLDISDRPLFDFGYAVIDAHVFMDEDGQAYLYYSRDCSENVVGSYHESHVYGIALAEDLKSVVGEPILLTKPDQEWELQSGDYRWNEGPYVLKNQDTYYLMYSANYYASRDYSVGYATSKHPLGPYVKYEYNPILATKPEWKEVSGPGHHSITTSADGKELWMIYHTHTVAQIGGGNRQLNADRMGFREDGSIFVNGPSLAWQLLPSGSGRYDNIASGAQIVYQGKESDYLGDGDASRHSQTKSLLVEEQTKLTLTWSEKKKIFGVRLYGEVDVGFDPSKIHVESNERIYREGFLFDNEEGGVVEAYFEEMESDELTIFFEEGGSMIRLTEVEILSDAFLTPSEDESVN